ncbi:MAG: glycerol-3-phosphate dehydrogenase/oxidase [Alicyclobacillaceae bacterium]|nr:glycerol-3-phosphate dehydrogenase/oxidase [Alicyclobacillaceae bacterium]
MQHRRPLATQLRHRYLQEMSQRELDLLVIGGGITGAGIALDAATRGLTVGLVERRDFASGTSSRSTKLIHGGLRYLKQGQLGLVREVARERSVVHRNAPYIVIPEKMLLPVVHGGTYGRLATSFGLWLYDRLAGVAEGERHVMLTKEQALATEPLLRRDLVTGAGLYTEYRTDDARLTVEVLKTAAAQGALCVNYASATAFLYQYGRIAGARVLDERGRCYDIRSRAVVNAAGPWADAVRRMDGPLRGKRLHLTKGVHIVVSRSRLPLRHAVYFDVPDGRMVFAIPRGNCTYVGTTDTDYDGPLDDPPVRADDVDYLLRAANHMFPGQHLGASDVIARWSGLRPLIHEDGKAPSALSRRDEVFVSETGLVTIAGGKLTGYRKMAERVVNLLVRRFLEGEAGVRPCATERLPLAGAGFPCGQPVAEWAEQLARTAEAWGLDAAQAASLAWRYGMAAKQILEQAREWLAAPRVPGVCGPVSPLEAVLLAELHYGVTEEMVTNLSDFLVRRTGRVWFEPDVVEQTSECLLAALAGWLNLDEAAVAACRRQLEADWLASRGPRDP